jgi:uncharacterized membrane protein
MGWFKPTSLLDKVFEGSLLLKGLSGLLELIGGLILLFVPGRAIEQFIGFVTQRELFEDPNDIVANYLVHATHNLTTTTHVFAVIFLLSHATVKFVIVIGLLRNERWAYPFSFITLGLMIMYQLYELVVHFSVGMLLLTLFDFFIMWLIWREYKKFTADQQPQEPHATAVKSLDS